MLSCLRGSIVNVRDVSTFLNRAVAAPSHCIGNSGVPNPFYELAEHTNVSRSSNAGLKPNTANRHTGAVAITISRAKIKQTRGAGTVIGLTMRLVIRAVRLGVTSLPQ